MPMTAPVLTPPLRDGEYLTREEFMLRWDAMPDLKFAELIDGIVYMASPVSTPHGVFQFRLSAWLASYLVDTPGCEVSSGASCLMSDDSVPQPDLALRILPDYGGQSHDEGQYSAGAPELITEVSHTTSVRDAGVKLRLYERSGVREYLIVRPGKSQVTWRELVDGKYREIPPDSDGLLRSHVFPGLWLDPAALWSGDLEGLAKPAQQGTATAGHADFVRELSTGKR